MLPASEHLNIMAGISHEIRNPVNAIIGLAHLLREEPDQEVQKELIDILIQSSEHLCELTSNILDYAKLEAGKVPRHVTPVDLRKEIPVVLFGQETMARSKGLNFVIDIAEAVPVQVLCDKVRGMQVLLNLVSNAIKFTREGSITLEVKVLELHPSKVLLRFAVRDTGMGIPREKQEQIFQPFRQGGSTTNLMHGGTGLGLSIADTLITSAGGTLKLESRPGRGSEFYFDLPMDIPVQMEIPVSENKVLSLKKILGNRKVLIVDDNEINLLVTGKTFENRDIRFTVTRSGIEALKKVQEEEFAAVLMDLHMPEMDGYEATCAIRKLQGEKYQSLPIIALSGSADLSGGEELLARGFSEFLTKPFRPQDLLEKIAEQVAKHDMKLVMEGIG